MATAITEAEREQLAAIPASYFRAVDAYDLPAVLAHFAEDATLTVQSARVWGRACFVGAHGTATFDMTPDVIHKQLTMYGAWT